MLGHSFKTNAADGANRSRLRPSNWGRQGQNLATDPTHEFTGGAMGSLLFRDTGATDGMNWLAAAEGVLACAGVGQAPAWTMTPTLDTLVIGDGAAIAGVGVTFRDTAIAFRPPAAPTAPVVANGAAGSIPAGTYKYKASWVGAAIGLDAAREETTLSTTESEWVADGAHNATVTKPAGTPPPNATGWAVYRSAVNATVDPLVGFIHYYQLSGPLSLATTSYTDSTADVTGNPDAGELSATLGCRLYSDGLVSAVFGTYNAGFGLYALQKNTTGQFNAAFGRGALMQNVTGKFNAAMGCDSLKENVSGDRNIAVGVDALQVNVSGSENVAVGNGALVLNLDSYNVAVGQGALSSNVSGEQCAGVGHQSLINSTQDFNTGLGASSGYSITSGVNNTFIGFFAGRNDSQKVNPSNSTALGANAYTTKDNQVVLGDANVTETLLRGSVGIGTTETTQARLTVVGDTYLGALPLAGIAWVPPVGNSLVSIHSNTAPTTSTGSVLTLGGRYRAADNAAVAYGSIAGLKENATNSNLDGTLRFFTSETNAGGSVERMRITSVGNVAIGVTALGTSATKTLGIGTGVEPASSPADMVQLYSVDLSAGNATLGIRTETAVATESVTSDRTLSVRINGTTYKICLKA